MRGDGASVENITRLKGEIDMQMQTAQQDFGRAERIATQSWSTSERISDQDFARATQILDQKFAQAQQERDIGSQEKIEQQRLELQLTMQTQGFDHDTKMAYLGQQLAEATAENDVVRQKSVMEYQSLLNTQQMAQEFGYDTARMELQKQIDVALQNNNNDNAMAMLNAQQRFTAEQASIDRSLEMMRIELQGRQIDMQGRAMTFDQIQAAVEAGQIDAQAAVDAVQKAAADYGIDVKAADPNNIYSELERDYKVQQYQWAQTHPEDAIYVDANGNEVPAGTAGATFSGLKTESAGQFNEFLNTSYYGPDGKPIVGGDAAAQSYTLSESGWWGEGTRILGSDGQPIATEKLLTSLRNADQANNANNATYQQLAAGAKTISPRSTSDTKNTIELGANEGDIVNVGGRLMLVSRGKHWEGEETFGDGRKRQEFELTDIATGTKRVFTGLSGEENYVANVSNWAGEFGNL
jgi:hypothetical protein